MKGEARRWYKNTKSSLKSWSIFVKEIKEAFLSPFHDELAFKKLESYTQGINQPVRSFYNEVLKLCNDTDPDMSETMKLRHLLKKAKPTLQYEIRKKKPTTTKQFLEYAKEQEELLQLSNIDIDFDFDLYDHKRSHPNNQPTSTVTSTRLNTSSPNTDNNTLPQYNQTVRSHSSFTNYKYNPRLTNSATSFTPSSQRNTPYVGYQPWQTNQQFSSNNQRTNNNSRQFSSNHQPYQSYQRPNNIHNNNQRTNQAPQINNIMTTTATSSSQPTPLLTNSDPCIQELETGHQASTGPRF